MAGIARPFIPWIGSKEKLIPYIWQVFPPSPKLYLEPFGGGGALLLGMQPKVSRMDIYNDFNCDLVNLFLCARECTVQLVRELKFIPFHSRAEFDLLKEFMKHKDLLQQRIADERNAVMECFTGEEREELLEILRERSCLFDVQRAAAYYKVCRGSFSGTTTSFGVKPNNITNFLYLFDDASKRLQDVVIENKDCLDIIRERDGPDSLIYCDPPYFDAESLYAVDFPKEKHEELHHILSQCAGSDILIEYQQSIEEGLDISAYQELFQVVSALPAGDIKKQLGDILFDIVRYAHPAADYAYQEPSELYAIRALRKRTPLTLDAAPLPLEKKITGAWMGRICGCMLGKSLESIRTNELIPCIIE